MPSLAKYCFVQGLRENICKVIMSVDILELDLPSPNVIPDEVIPNLNMLRLEVLQWHFHYHTKEALSSQMTP